MERCTKCVIVSYFTYTFIQTSENAIRVDMADLSVISKWSGECERVLSSI